MSQYILALDQGTTSSRAIAFDREGAIAAVSQQPLPQHYPCAGWVEHDPLEIWDTQRRAAAEAAAHLPEGSVAGIGVTNQRETTILWDKATGEPVYNAIVWQCRRTAELCEELKRRGLELERVAYVLTRKSSRKYEEIYEQMDQYTARPHLLEVSLRPGAVGYEFWRDKLVGEVRRYLDAQ